MRSLALMNDGYQFWMGGRLATQLEEITQDPARLENPGFWAVVLTFEGVPTFARFGKVTEQDFPESDWEEIHSDWTSSLNKKEYENYVAAIREEISRGSVYQVNACRILTNTLTNQTQSLAGLFSRLLTENPAPHASYLKLPDIEIASASPELFLAKNGKYIQTSPIKGTIRENEAVFGEKDQAENLMIVDLMRNDLGKICEPGSVDVKQLFRHEKHPGLVHLVSDVVGTLRTDVHWADIFRATMSPGSVSGAPKSAALSIIESTEGRRGPYCGAIGWIEGESAVLSVGIRAFWKDTDTRLHFGTGAGITWGSSPTLEWEETALKARKLISIAGGQVS